MDTGIAEPLRALIAPSRDRSSRRRIGAGALVVLLLAALACATLLTALGPAGSTDVVEPTSVGAEGPAPAAPPGATGPTGGSAAGGNAEGASEDGGGGDGATDPAVIDASSVDTAGYFVHVLGAVARPGLYELADSARVIDAIAAAGGLLDTADPARVNLARRLTDGEQLHVPAVGEAVPPGLAQPPPATGGAAGGAAASPGDAPAQVVNLNSATVEQLDALPRIGPALARRIVDWREANGRFASVDDLLSVTGIGETILEGLRAAATV